MPNASKLFEIVEPDLDVFPTRLFLVGDRRPSLDAYGFVQPMVSDEVLSAKDLLKLGATLITAPPWTGKSFVAEEIFSALKQVAPAPPPEIPRFDDRCHLTSFEKVGRVSRIEPDWWAVWEKGAKQACWLIDAIDEDERRQERQVLRALEHIEHLSEAARSRLHVLFFARENETPPHFVKKVEEIWPGTLRKVRLASLDRTNAARYVGSEAKLEHICRIIEEHKLQSIAGLPAVLLYLKKTTLDQFDNAEVWRGVLKSLMQRGGQDHEAEDLFTVATWLAAVLTFSGSWELEEDYPILEEVIPQSLDNFRLLRQAGRAATKTAIFRRSENGYQFAQDHVRQWLAAFALAGMKLPQVRSLLTATDGQPNLVHEGVMGSLNQIAQDRTIKDWIVEIHGGIAPPSDAAPWSLAEACHALDRLQDLAKSSAWGLSLWREQRLHHLAVPGIGAVLARRLAESSSSLEQHFLLDVTMALEVSEPVEPMIRIVQDSAQNLRIRQFAASLVGRLATIDQLQGLAPWVESYEENADDSDIMIFYYLAYALFKNGLWEFDRALRFSMEHRKPHVDWLIFALGENLTLDQARSVVRYIVSADYPAGGPENRSNYLPAAHLEEKAIGLLVSSGTNEDYDLLLPIALKPRDSRFTDVALRFRNNETARRKLFLSGLDLDPDRSINSHWFTALTAEDIEWLFDILKDRKNDPSWLLSTLHFFLYANETDRSLRARIRRRLLKTYPAQVEQLDQDRRRQEQFNRQWKSKENDPKPIYELTTLITRILQLRRLDLRQRMLNISRLCFTRPQDRPTNLKGQWEDLPENLRQETIDVCSRALCTGEPTPIPDQSSFPSSILWEAACFSHMANNEASFILNSAVIRKWLPALFKVYEGDWETTLQRCSEVDQILCEDIAFEAIRRESMGASDVVFTAQQFPPNLWSHQLAERILKLVEGDEIKHQVRIYLLDRVARVFPEMARPVAQRWAQASIYNANDLKYAGTDILLVINPSQGWLYLEKLLESEQPRAMFLRMRSLQPNHYGPSARLESWPAELLGRLADLLFQTFPPAQDPVREPGKAYSLGAEDDLLSLRDKIALLLFRRGLKDDQEILDRLSASHPTVRQWLDYTRAQQGADNFLEEVDLRRPAARSTGAYITRSQVVKLLQDSRYRLLRSQDDLQAVVLEELQAISQDAMNHLGMLYRPKIKKAERRKRLHEEALQAYLHCRLNDRLRSALDPMPRIIFLDREPLAARNTRNDIKIQTIAQDRQPLALVIEVKWSDNPEVSTSLIEQLAQDYLLKNGITHGIYFVGWSGVPGTWRRVAVGKPPVPRTSLDAWRTSLDQQVKLLSEKHQELSIVPFILDLSWNPEQ